MSDNIQEEKLSPLYDPIVDFVLIGITGNNILKFTPDHGNSAATLRARDGVVHIHDEPRTYSPPIAQVTLDTMTGITLDNCEPLTWSGHVISSELVKVPIENPILRALLKAMPPEVAIYDVTAGMITLLIPAPTPHPNKVIRVVVIDSSNPKNYQPQSNFSGVGVGYRGPNIYQGYRHPRPWNNQRHQMDAGYHHVPRNPLYQRTGAVMSGTAIFESKVGVENDTTQLLPKDLKELEYLHKSILAYLLLGPNDLDEHLRKYLIPGHLSTLDFFATWLHQFDRYTSHPILVSLIVGTHNDLGWSSSDVESTYDELRDLIASINEAIVLTKCKHREAVKSASLSGTKNLLPKSLSTRLIHGETSNPYLQSSTVVKDTGKLWRDTLKIEEVNQLYTRIADYLSGKPDIDLRLAPVTVDEAVCLNTVRTYWDAACKDLGPDIHNYPLLSQLTAMLGMLADGMPDSFKLRDRKHYQEVVQSFTIAIYLIREMTNFINGEVSSV